jgi:hypothetical protein
MSSLTGLRSSLCTNISTMPPLGRSGGET